MKHKTLLALVFYTILSTAILYAGKTNLDIMQLKDWKIVSSQDAIESEVFAAQEFQSLFQQATEIKLEIVNTPAERNNIFIGFSEGLLKSDAGFEIKDLGSEGLRIKITKNNIAIAGGRPRGTLYGVYEFAEKYLAVRFLTFDHTYIPPIRKEIVIPCETYFYKPCFVYRNTYYKENMLHPEFSVRLRNNSFAKEAKYGGMYEMTFISHSFYRQLPVDKFGKEHPEYFAEVGGKRLLEAYGGGPQLCVTNPEVIRIMTDAVIAEIEKHPEQKNVSIVQNDNQYYCMCKNCEAINQKEACPMGSHLALVNAVADNIKSKYPDVKIGTLAYQYTRKAPANLVPRDNVMVQLCSIECNLLKPYYDKGSEMNVEFAKDLAAWGKICENLWIWDYIVDYNCYGLPFPNLKSIGANIRYYRNVNVKGVFMEANYQSTGELSDLRNYITSRCLWNPSLDSWELTKEFCELHYAKAAKPILEYLETLHKNIDKYNLKAKFNATPKEIGLDAKLSEYIMNKYEEALKLADNDIVRERVEKASLCAMVAFIETARGEVEYQNNRLNFKSSEKYKQVLTKFPGLAKKYGMNYYFEDETGKIDVIEKDFNNELAVYKAGGRPASQLLNENWRITALNGEDGKIAELYNDNEDINLLPAFKNNLKNGFISETFIKGKNDKDSIKYIARTENNFIELAANLKNGTEVLKKIVLPADKPNNIIFSYLLTNNGDSVRTYQLKVAPVFETGTRTRNSDIIRAFVKGPNKYLQFNKGMIHKHGPDEKMLIQYKDGGLMAFFNYEKKYGIIESYDKEQVEELDAAWMDSGSQMKLGFNTKEFTLKPGQSYSFGFVLSFIKVFEY
ncbi:MAG: DUF4838 domain-containing protein [Bacteroidales bacterium]|nr:DUF4838 domain-containing protein [Bacteroidales bacterium]